MSLREFGPSFGKKFHLVIGCRCGWHSIVDRSVGEREGEGGKGEDGGESMGRSKSSVGLLAVVLPVQGRIFSSCHMMELLLIFLSGSFLFAKSLPKL